MQKRFLAGLALVLALALLASTSSSAGQSAATAANTDNAALRATEEILKNVSRLRRLEAKERVKSGLKTQNEIEQSVIKDLDETTSPEEFEASQKVLLKLGLVPKGFRLREYIVKLLREQVAGFYEPKTREFYLASWVPIAEQKTVIAHELVHALQDQHFNLRRLEKWPKGDSDAELAARALVEGEATIVMIQYDAEQQGVYLDLARLNKLTEQMKAMSNAGDEAKYPVLSGAPTVLRESLQFPYIYGAGFAQAVLKHGSWQAINDGYANLPSSTEQIMHPERFISRDNPIKIELNDQLPTLGSGWKLVDRDINGEFGYLLLLGEFIDKGRARTAAAGWGGDRYALYENNATGATLLAHYTTWDTEQDAREFFAAYAERTQARYQTGPPDDTPAQTRTYRTNEGYVSVELVGKDVVIIEGAQDRKQLAAVSDQMRQSKKTPR